MSITAEKAERPLRRDAVENRERVLAAAVAMFAREGRDVSMAAIADAAGVGVGTLYRRYRTREELLDALTERSFGLVHTAITEAAGGGGPAIVILGRFLDTTIDHRHELVLPLHGGPRDLGTHAAALQSRIRSEIASVLALGRHDHTLRTDVTAADVIVFGALLAHTLSADESTTALLRRQASIFLDGLAPGPRQLGGLS